MNDPNYGSIVFSVECYDGNYDAMWMDISNTLQILFKLDYMARVHTDWGDLEIIIIDFCYADEQLTDGNFQYVTFKEMESLKVLRGTKEKDKLKDE